MASQDNILYENSSVFLRIQYVTKNGLSLAGSQTLRARQKMNSIQREISTLRRQ